MLENELELTTYQMGLTELMTAYELAEKLNDTEKMLDISVSMELLISSNEWNSTRILQ